MVHVPLIFLSEWREFPTTLSIPSYGTGNLVGLRTYQQYVIKVDGTRYWFITKSKVDYRPH
jgi:hypothetical protein